MQLLRLEIGAIYVTTFPPTSAQCSPEGGTGSGRGLLPICSRFCRSEGPVVSVSVFPLILWPTGSETDHSPQPLQVKMEPIMRAPCGEVVLPITELIRVGAKVDGTSFRLRRWG